MAFFSLFVVFFGIVVFILSVMALIGIVCLIAGLVKRKNSIKQGKKASYGLMKAGIFFLGVPVMLVRFLVLSTIGSTLKTHLLRLGHKNVVDKWKNERVISEENASREAIEELLEAADHNDRSAIIALFPENLQKDFDLGRQVDHFLEEYSGKFSGLELEYKGGGGQRSTHYGHVVYELSCDYEVVKDGERYYIEIYACYQNTDHPEEVGITYFSMDSERGEVFYDEIRDHPWDWEEYYISARFDVGEDYETRRVGGYPWKFTPIDRTITKEQIISAYNNAHNLNDLIEKLGEPNGIKRDLGRVLYEIESENDEPRYAEMNFDYYERIVSILTICGPEQGSEAYEWFEKPKD